MRVFLTPSAPVDSLAGMALALPLRGAPLEAWLIAVTAATSILLYWFGMATNDLFDREKDRHAAPGRPLPSGRLQPRHAIAVALLCAALALLCGAIAGAALHAAAVGALAISYNAGGKRVPIAGNILMGACRSANLLLGWTAAADAGPAAAFASGQAILAAVVIGLYVAGITAVSALEDRPYRPVRFHLRATPLLAVPLFLGALQPHSAALWAHVVGILWLLIASQRRAASLRLPDHPAKVHVRAALGTLALVDAAIVWALCPDPQAAVTLLVLIYALAVLGWWCKRRWIQSGRADT